MNGMVLCCTSISPERRVSVARSDLKTPAVEAFQGSYIDLSVLIAGRPSLHGRADGRQA